MPQTLLLSKITKNFGTLPVLNSLSFEVKEGEFLAIVGPSGCGKSTLLRIVAGLLKPDTGTITSAYEASSKPTFELMFQEPALLPWRSVYENIALPFELRHLPIPKERVELLVSLVGLIDFKDHHPAQLSGGMQQRVALARALAPDPAILLLDEPFGALDAILRSKMNDELLRVRNNDTTKQRTTILVTHSIEEAVYLADRIIVLSDRPARIKNTFEVSLTRPRSQASRREAVYQETVHQIRTALL